MCTILWPNIIYNDQLGFRKEHSTQHTLITLVDKIIKALDKGRIMIGVFLDLKKAIWLCWSQHIASYMR